MDLGKLHVVLVHFPIAFAIGAVAADLLWLATRRTIFQGAGLFCLVAALAASAPVAATGWMRAESIKVPPDLADTIDDHEHAALVSVGILAAATAVRVLRIKKPAKWQPAVYAVLMAALAAGISFTGHLGGQIAFGKDYLSGLF